MPIRLLRVIDALTYSFLLLVAILCWPGLTVALTGELRMVYMLPLTAMILSTWSFSEDDWMDISTTVRIVPLKLSALCMVGLAPFVAWYVSAPHSLYLLLCSWLFGLVFYWYLLELLGVLRAVVLSDHHTRLLSEIRFVRQALLYAGVVPFASVCLAFGLGLIAGSLSVDVFLILAGGVAPLVFVFMLMPLLMAARVLFQVRRVGAGIVCLNFSP